LEQSKAPSLKKLEAGTMAKKKSAKNAAKKSDNKVSSKKRTPKRQEPASTRPTDKQNFVPFEVCNYYGVYLREIFEKEHLRNRNVQLGEVFECLLNDLHGAWNLVKLYGKEATLESLRGKGNPFHHDK
jgi:hypothetical protein